MKHLFLFAAFSALFPLFLHAADPNPEQDPVLLKAKLAILEADRAKTMNELTDLRMKHIRSDKNLKRMHDNIMVLHRNLALALDSKKDVRDLNDKLLRLDSEIRSARTVFNQTTATQAEKK